MTNDQLHELAYLRFLMKENITKLESRRDNARTLLNELDEKFEKGWQKIIKELSDFSAASIETAFKSFLTEKEIGIGAVLLPYRFLPILQQRRVPPSSFCCRH